MLAGDLKLFPANIYPTVWQVLISFPGLESPANLSTNSFILF